MRRVTSLVSVIVWVVLSNAAWAAAHPTRVAILLFDGAEVIDYSGPFEVFSAAGYDVFTVGRTKAPVTTTGGLTVVPKYDFSDVPEADIVLVPGGDVDAVRKDPQTLAWIRKETARDRHTISVCNGALTLADAGLLDGLSATSTFYWIPRMRTAYPKIHMVDDRRWVDNGKIITTAGLSAGIDGALHLVEVMNGRGAAQSVALALEYDWHPDGGFVRAALADSHIPDVDLGPLGQASIRETDGDRTHWLMRIDIASLRSAAQIQDYLSQKLVEQGHWVSQGAGRWHFTDRLGMPWSGTLDVVPVAHGRYTINVTVKRQA